MRCGANVDDTVTLLNPVYCNLPKNKRKIKKKTLNEELNSVFSRNIDGETTIPRNSFAVLKNLRS